MTIVLSINERLTILLLLILSNTLVCIRAVELTNVALNKPTEQSSNYHDTDGHAKAAVDGNTDGNFPVKSTTHTVITMANGVALKGEHWWQVDFEAEYWINHVTIFNRSDCCQERLSNSVLELIGADGSTIVKRVNIGDMSTTLSKIFDIEEKGVAMRLKNSETVALSIAEFQAFGYRYMYPSTVPSRLPSTAPSTVPSTQPSRVPSSVPSSKPSYPPSVVPSYSPTFVPSFEPSAAPSSKPSIFPSWKPSTYPSLLPSNIPTSPLLSDAPSNLPTSISSIPSVLPSYTPTSAPIYTSTTQPSISPTVPPSDVPTLLFTVVPSTVPSKAPSTIQSKTPSTVPSRAPSGNFSEYPSAQPSFIDFLSSYPSSKPSVSESIIEDDSQTLEPSSNPSFFPSSIPSDNVVFDTVNMTIELEFSGLSCEITQDSIDQLESLTVSFFNQDFKEKSVEVKIIHLSILTISCSQPQRKLDLNETNTDSLFLAFKFSASPLKNPSVDPIFEMSQYFYSGDYSWLNGYHSSLLNGNYEPLKGTTAIKFAQTLMPAVDEEKSSTTPSNGPTTPFGSMVSGTTMAAVSGAAAAAASSAASSSAAAASSAGGGGGLSTTAVDGSNTTTSVDSSTKWYEGKTGEVMKSGHKTQVLLNRVRKQFWVKNPRSYLKKKKKKKSDDKEGDLERGRDICDGFDLDL